MRFPLLIPCRDRDPGGPSGKQKALELFGDSVLGEIPRSIPRFLPSMNCCSPVNLNRRSEMIADHL